MTRYLRAAFILWVILRYGLDELALSGFRPLRGLARVITIGRRRRLEAPRGQRLRQALEHLGPIFVKFGQVLSTRRDLLPPDIADELALLQDRVPPFPSEVAVATIERAFRRPLAAVFESFELSTYAFAISTAFGMSWALASRAHIRIEVVYNALPLKVRAVLDVFAYAALAVVACTLLYWCTTTVMSNAASGARSNSSLAMPLVVPQSLWLAGLAWFALLAVLYTLSGLWLMLRQGAAPATALLGVASLQEEIDANAPGSTVAPAGQEKAAC